VLAGFGRVGRVVGIALLRRRFRVLVIEEDRRTFNELRRRGVPALLGNAANPVLLERANLREARLLVVAFPDPFAARLIVDYARGINRRLDIVVRTHTEEQTAFMRARHVSEVVMGEHELALEITRHALHRFGVAASEAQATVIGLRERLSEGDPLDDWTEEG
jgi:CPA2 family monovalent cation:H+ antiporter-2